jgi:hypothetical protein
MAVNLSPVGGVAAQFFDNAGNVLTGGKLYTYAAGTTTPQTTYTTSAGNIAWSNPIILDAAGRVSGSGEIWLSDGTQYKFILRDTNDVLIATYDNVIGINSNFVNFINEQEIQTATAGQTVFNLTTTTYSPGTNSLSVFVDGVNQYGPGAQYAYFETDSDTVTFVNGLHVGALVKFTTSQLNSSASGDASQISFTGFKGQTGNVQDLADNDGSDWIGFEQTGTGAIAISAQDKMREWVSVKDFGAVGNGVADDTAEILNAIAYAKTAKCDLYIPSGIYILTGSNSLEIDVGLMSFIGQGDVTFDCTGMTAAYAMQVYNSINTYPDGQLITPKNQVSGFKLLGDNTLDGLLIAHPTYVHNHQILIEGCVFEYFNNNVTLGSNAWRVMFNRCNFQGGPLGSSTNLLFLSGAVNAGESMCFLHCQFVGSSIEIDYPAQIMFYSSSLLVCPLISNASSVFCQFFGGNIENPGSHLDESYIDIQGQTSWFGIHGTGIVMNTFAGQSFTKALFVVKEASSTLALFGVLLPETPYYTASTLDTYSYSSGAGRVISYGGMYFPLGGAGKPNLSAGLSNCIYNYGFELGNTNGWVVTPYGTGGATAVASTTAKDHGVYGLLATAVSGGGVNITQTMSCVAGQLVRANCNARVASSTTATVGFVQVAYTTDNGTVVATYGQAILSTDTSWGTFGGVSGAGSAVNPVPPGATKVTFTLNVQPGSGGTNVIYFDDAVLNVT